MTDNIILEKLFEANKHKFKMNEIKIVKTRQGKGDDLIITEVIKPSDFYKDLTESLIIKDSLE